LKSKEIIIKGHKVLIDANMWPFVKLYKWGITKSKMTSYARTHIFINSEYKHVSMHRLLSGMTKMQIDHKNRDGLDNRSENLRYVNSSQNACNKYVFNKHGYRGVFYPKGALSYGCQIKVKGKKYIKKGFKTAKDAAIAYDEMSRTLHGEHGIRNFGE